MPTQLPPDQVIYYFLNDLGKILEYTEFQERWLEEEYRRYDNHIRSDTDEEWDRYGNRRNLSASLSMIFPQLGRHSLVVYLYSLLEDSLNQFCFSLEVERKLQTSLGDAKKKGLKRAKHYIVKNTDIDFPSSSREWQYACDMRLLRDKLVHTLGHLDNPKDAHLRKFVERTSGLSTRSFAGEEIQIQIESFFVEEACGHLERLANKILNAYRKSKKVSYG